MSWSVPSVVLVLPASCPAKWMPMVLHLESTDYKSNKFNALFFLPFFLNFFNFFHLSLFRLANITLCTQQSLLALFRHFYFFFFIILHPCRCITFFQCHLRSFVISNM